MTRKDVESLFKTHYTQMYHLALTLLFDEAESKDVVSEVFASLISSKAAIKREQSDAGISSAEREQARPKVKVVMRTDNAKAFLLASVRHRCLNVLQHKQVQERFARLLTEDADTLKGLLITWNRSGICSGFGCGIGGRSRGCLLLAGLT